MTSITASLTRDELAARLARLPRVRFAHLPTPLEDLPRLTESLGGPRILVKREDATGLAFGGNKARHYEFEMAHLQEQGFNAIVNVMDYHSNNARVTAASANKMGFKYVLILKNAKGRPSQGNLLIDTILGAELHLLDEDESDSADDLAVELGRRLESEGYKPYLRQQHAFPKYVGCVAYLDCGLELAEQLEGLGITENVHIFGVSGRSTAGLMLTAKNLGLDWKATGIAVSYEVDMQEYLYDVISGAEKELDLPVSFQPSDMRVLDQYIGEGYGIPTEGVIEAVHMLGRLEGLMIDPNYTGTVMSALIDQIRQGNLSKDETIVFLHTGGLPAIFTFAEELAAYEG
ncbi:MAG: pyridoxal-phosphate dependent enzyme [Chloroflexi bacterium]|nr:pyridoxal-phosphate dependent enzyme [Chloroflexota bacterium]